jgi:hypothetical protein
MKDITFIRSLIVDETVIMEHLIPGVLVSLEILV